MVRIHRKTLREAGFGVAAKLAAAKEQGIPKFRMPRVNS
jgi:hypothetical protein